VKTGPSMFREALGSVPSHAVLEPVRDVVLVQCSSRGGSSVFMEMLRHSRSLHHLSGEIGPALAAAGLTFPHSETGSDALGAEHATNIAIRTVHHALRQDVGNPSPGTDTPQTRQQLINTIHWRLAAQWPSVSISETCIHDAVEHAFSQPLIALPFSQGQRFHASFLQHIRSVYPTINPWYYDLDPALIRGAFPGVPEPKGPPGDWLIEEPPFVLSGPWDTAPDDALGSRPLILKTPSNAYRMPFLRALFPSARIRVVHLLRNPAASINGLVDGWRFRGFHAHRMDRPLEIDGIHSEDRFWWKYDLPPGWQDWRTASLVEVAGFQWSSAHRSILDSVSTDPKETHRLRFEDIVGPRRQTAFQELFSWLDLPLDEPMSRVIHDGLPPVMATERPRQRRWFDRAEQLDPVLQTPRVSDVAHTLGYRDRSDWL